MKITHTHKIGLFDIAHDSTLKLETMARFFQDIAVHHTLLVNQGPEYLFSNGKVWYLHRLEIEVVRYPVFGDEITLTTWSRGFRQSMGFREYSIASKGETMVKAGSVWVFFDVARHRVTRFPAEMAAAFGSEDQSQFDRELYLWRPEPQGIPEVRTDISLRYSDFDVNGHVNNTIYPGFVETLCHTAAERFPDKIRRLKFRLVSEIPLGKTKIRAGSCNAGDGYNFVVNDPADPSVIYCEGKFFCS